MQFGISRRAVSVCLLCITAIFAATSQGRSIGDQAGEILSESGVSSGFMIHVGCGDGKVTAMLRSGHDDLIHGLDRDPDNVESARRHIVDEGIYGEVSVDLLTGSHLPYIDNLANLVIVEANQDISQAEVQRVLGQGGVAMFKRGGKWIRSVKARPAEIDEWTHYLYDPTNNAVSKDKAIKPLRRIQWQGSPRWSRHHDHMSSMSSLVSTRGRLFYIFDEGSTASIMLPSKWFLVGRDAFNGVILWKRPMGKWHTQLWPLKSGPALLTRRLVAVDDTVFVTLSLDGPLTAVDAATGKTLRTYQGTDGAEEIIVSDNTVLLVINKDVENTWASYESIADIKHDVKGGQWSGGPKSVMAVQADSGRILWSRDSFVAPSTLATDGRTAYFHDGEKIHALDAQTGEPRWQSESLPVWKTIHSYFVPCLVLYDDVVLWAGGEKMVPHRGGSDIMTALAARTGKKLWSAPHAASGYQSAEDLLVAGGLVWTGATTNGGYDGIFRGYDPHTGELKREFGPNVEPYWFHHRCYRAKATEDYLLMSRTGIEYLDIDKQDWTLHHWVRGACLTGIVPANGMVYAPPHDCACYPEAKIFGFAAMAPASQSLDKIRSSDTGKRLLKGPAFGKVLNPGPANRAEWPTYRQNAARTGRTDIKVDSDITPMWTAKLEGRLSAVTVANGKAFVAAIDQHRLHAFDAETGAETWSYFAGGRIDSPPTIWAGMCIFGSADGHVYCLRASDGKLVWRFRAAPVDQRHTSFEQIESVWPVHGSVLVQDDAVYVVAGRSMFVDGGLYLYKLDARTGKVLVHKHYDDTDPETGGELQDRHQILQMPVALPDILSSDGKHLYMRSQVFDLQGNRQQLGPHTGDLVLQATVQRGETAHMFAPYGFLDDTWFHRSYWVYGRSFSGGHGGYYRAGKFAPAGRILTADDKKVYGYGREAKYLKWTTPMEYHLFATDRQAPELPEIRPGNKTAGPGPWISIENSPGLDPTAKPLAVEARINSEKPSGVVVARGGPTHGYSLFLKAGKAHFAVRVKEKVYQVASANRVTGRWTHLAGVLTVDKKLQIYVDGKISGQADGDLISGEPSQATEIGADDGSAVADYDSPFCFTGLIDDVRIYHGSITAAEIAEHSTAGIGKDPRLVLAMSFDKGKPRDSSGAGNHGKINQVKAETGPDGGVMRFSGKVTKTGSGNTHYVQYGWSVDNPAVVARAMALTDGTLFVAGPPDVLDEDAAAANLTDAALRKQIIAQDQALAGRKGGLLLAVDIADGSIIEQSKLDFVPAWDGMAAAYGRLYITTTNGRLVCLGGK